VDDDPILREFASVYLATPSATIDTACDGAEARLRLEQNVYDILLLDIEMPRVDGFALLAEIRSNESLKHLPVIMLTVTTISRRSTGPISSAPILSPRNRSIGASSAITFATSSARAGRRAATGFA